MTNVNKAIDKIYIKTLQDNIRKSLKHNKSKEQHMELAPIGYKSIRDENNKIDIIVDSKQASIIMKLFRAYATEEYTIKQVFELARSLGLVNQQGNAVSERCVNNILKNPFYYGKIRINNQLMPHKYQTFIEKSLFDRVQEVMDSRRIKK